MSLSIRRAKARAAHLRDALEVGDTWHSSDEERAFNFKKRWDELIAKAPRSKRHYFERLGAQIAEESLTFKRLVWGTEDVLPAVDPQSHREQPEPEVWMQPQSYTAPTGRSSATQRTESCR